jgi:hypothetical protein
LEWADLTRGSTRVDQEVDRPHEAQYVNTPQQPEGDRVEPASQKAAIECD